MTIEDVLSGAATHHVACERAESFIDTLPDGCVSLMTLDFPYYGVKDDAWDNAWPTPEAFIAWMGEVLAKCRRVLAPNGSLYVFAASQVRGGLTMATRVEVEVARHFQIVNRITWRKSAGWHEKAEQEAQRGFFPASEAIVFAESNRSMASTVRALRNRASLTTDAVERALGFVDNKGRGSRLCYRWECGDCVPTKEQWARLLTVVGASGPSFETACRPFSVSSAVPYTDVWTYETVNTYPGKHPCEKPFSMAENMIAASSRPGDLVADFFCGSGTFLAAAVHSGRRAVGCDMAPEWADFTRRRIESGPMQWRDFGRREGRRLRTAAAAKPGQLDLFRSA